VSAIVAAGLDRGGCLDPPGWPVRNPTRAAHKAALQAAGWIAQLGGVISLAGRLYGPLLAMLGLVGRGGAGLVGPGGAAQIAATSPPTQLDLNQLGGRVKCLRRFPPKKRCKNGGAAALSFPVRPNLACMPIGIPQGGASSPRPQLGKRDATEQPRACEAIGGDHPGAFDLDQSSAGGRDFPQLGGRIECWYSTPCTCARGGLSNLTQI